MFKVLPKVERFGTAIIGPQSEKKVSSLANPFRGLGGIVRGRVQRGAVGYGGVSIKS